MASSGYGILRPEYIAYPLSFFSQTLARATPRLMQKQAQKELNIQSCIRQIQYIIPMRVHGYNYFFVRRFVGVSILMKEFAVPRIAEDTVTTSVEVGRIGILYI